MASEEHRKRMEAYLGSFKPAEMPQELEEALEGMVSRSPLPQRPTFFQRKWKLVGLAALVAVTAGIVLFLSSNERQEHQKDEVLKVPPKTRKGLTEKTITVLGKDNSATKSDPEKNRVVKKTDPRPEQENTEKRNRDKAAALKVLAQAFHAARLELKAGRFDGALDRWGRVPERTKITQKTRWKQYRADLEKACDQRLQSKLVEARAALKSGQATEASRIADSLAGLRWIPGQKAANALRSEIGKGIAASVALEQTLFQELSKAVSRDRKAFEYQIGLDRIRKVREKIKTPQWVQKLDLLKSALKVAQTVPPAARQTLEGLVGKHLEVHLKNGILRSGKVLSVKNDLCKLRVGKGAETSFIISELDAPSLAALAARAPKGGRPPASAVGLAHFLIDAGQLARAVKVLSSAPDPLAKSATARIKLARKDSLRQLTGKVHGKVALLESGRVALRYDFQDPEQLKDWSLPEGAAGAGGRWLVINGKMTTGPGTAYLKMPLLAGGMLKATLTIPDAGLLAKADKAPSWLRAVGRSLMAGTSKRIKRPTGKDPSRKRGDRISAMSQESTTPTRTIPRNIPLSIRVTDGRILVERLHVKPGQKKTVYNGRLSKESKGMPFGGGVVIESLRVEGELRPATK